MFGWMLESYFGSSYKCEYGCLNVTWDGLINVWKDVGMLDGKFL